MTAQPAETASFFTDTQRELLHAILNRIIPASESFPGAGDLGVASYVDTVVGQAVELRHLFVHGLTQIDIISQERYTQAFVTLSDHQKDAVLRHIEAGNPEFFAALVTRTYSGYYINPAILRLLGSNVQPPQPRGYELEPLDLNLLDRVKQRRPLYRPA
jgi:Gluconate 2-dehydrogenase subunit 3